MAFNADAFRAAHRPWEFVVGGRRFAAQPVSTPAMLAFHEAVKRAGADLDRQNRALRQLLRRAFPWRFSYLAGDPVKILLALEPLARKEALADFFECQAGRPTEPTSPTTGTGSPNRTLTPAA